MIMHYNSCYRQADTMTRLFVTVCLLVAAASAAPTPGAPLVPLSHAAHPSYGYAFNYAVNDPHSHDKKAQWEIRNGDAVKGSYSLVEPDGSLRIVEYSANAAQGFNAVVKKVGPNLHSATITKVPHAPVKTAVLRPVGHLGGPWRPSTHYSYGFGVNSNRIPNTAALGRWSLKWDPISRSYGGWTPYTGSVWGPSGPHARILTRKYDGKGRLVRTSVSAPFPISKLRH